MVVTTGGWVPFWRVWLLYVVLVVLNGRLVMGILQFEQGEVVETLV